MTNRIEQQIAERTRKYVSFATSFNRENEFTYEREEEERRLEMLKAEQAEAKPEQQEWYLKAIARSEEAIRQLMRLEAERRKYDELKSHLWSLANVY